MDSLIRKVIKKEFSRMNDMQFSAVSTTKGPLLVLAGAGSGKTTVLINRIANLIKYGDAYMDEPELFDEDLDIAQSFLNGEIDEMPSLRSLRYNAPAPWQILAITFTNKAANEIKARLNNMLGEVGTQIWAGTFHSTCAKILRFDGESLGYSSHFTIYDSADQKRVVKDCMKALNIDEKFIPVKSVINEISRAKDELIDCEEYLNTTGGDTRKLQIGKVYTEYQRVLKESDAMDFDDLIYNTVRLLETDKAVCEKYQQKFKYIMVDEYQDTSHAQYMLVRLLADGYKNICVVGDDDQSIYSFRGATIENILNFENQYKNAKIIRLEQNYRSTSNILNAANSVIENNIGRKGKTLWTANGNGDKITIHTSISEQDEARFVADTILKKVREGGKFSDSAVLYRMNAQSNSVENTFMRLGIHYKIVGGLRFYDRKEIKDVMSYLAFINNPADALRLSRIINEPKRGIGAATVEKASQIALATGRTMFDIISHADEFAVLSRSAKKLHEFSTMMQQLIDIADEISVHELLEQVLDVSGYMMALKASGNEGIERIENVNELSSNILIYEQENEQSSLSDFLEQVSLITDLDGLDETEDRVTLMTLHAAKGLEFDNVFLIGLEEGIFPGTQSMFGGDSALEEERRLAYVGITRAKKCLYITNAKSRMLFGKTTRNMQSRFVKEIPDEYTIIEKPNDDYRDDWTISSRRSDNDFVSSKKLEDFFAKKPVATGGSSVSFKIGDRVMHKTFGEGMIINSKKMGNDSLLEIAFDTCGTKKVMAKFAKIEKI